MRGFLGQPVKESVNSQRPTPNVYGYRVRFERCHVSQWRLGRRPEKCASGACLQMAASARVVRRPVHHRLGRRVPPTLVAKQRLSGSGCLRRIFELTPRAARIAPLADMAPLRTR
jgi:hypothetical protein